jgi:hypothetical protein
MPFDAVRGDQVDRSADGAATLSDTASAAESALMIPDAFHLRSQYADLEIIIEGEEDRLVDIETEPARLRSDISLSGFHRVPGNDGISVPFVRRGEYSRQSPGHFLSWRDVAVLRLVLERLLHRQNYFWRKRSVGKIFHFPTS